MLKPAKLQKLPPVWLVRAITLFRNALLKLNKNLFPGNVVLYEQFQVFWLLPSLYIAAKLDIAGFLKNGPRSVHEIAEHTGTNPDSLHRILRALSSQGIFFSQKDGRFRLNRISRGLLDENGSLRYTLLHHLGPVNWNLMSNLMVAVKTGNDPFTDRYGISIYDYLQQHPDEYEVFDKSMSNLSDLGLAPILNAYEFNKYPTIVDIGGGEGFFLANILMYCPASKGVLFDLPEAIGKSYELVASFNIADRVEITTGDFFSDVPASGDLYILKNIIHNWNDDDCIRLLTTLRRCIKKTARILIIDMVVQTPNKLSLAPLLDIQMLACMRGGKERTKSEFVSIIEKSGFKVLRLIPTIAPISIFEAAPLISADNA